MITGCGFVRTGVETLGGIYMYMCCENWVGDIWVL